MESPDLLRSLVSLLFVLALILLVAWAFKRFGLERRFISASGKGEPRLKIVERLMLDPKRRLVVVRFDNREHLILSGPTQDVLIESYDVSGREVKDA
tara:strand:- start:11 stop:301 length:291 start_codon:yes stop_codon:yes gene_type:complete